MVISKKALMVITTFITLNVNISASMEISNSSTDGIQPTQKPCSSIGNGTSFCTDKCNGNTSSNVPHSNNVSKELEESFWNILPPYTTYKMLTQCYRIPVVNWSDNCAVKSRKDELLKEFQTDYLRKNGNVAKGADVSQTLTDEIIKVCLFEKLYTKYSSKQEVNLSEQEYLTVFNMLKDIRGISCAEHVDYKWFARFKVHRPFILKEAVNDKTVFENEKIRNLYDRIVFDDSIDFTFFGNDGLYMQLGGTLDEYEHALPNGVEQKYNFVTIGKLLCKSLGIYTSQIDNISKKLTNYKSSKK